MDNNYPQGVSVVICCFNSAARLPETLRHLARQDCPSNLAWLQTYGHSFVPNHRFGLYMNLEQVCLMPEEWGF